jgi:hypothetical protein
VALSHTVQNPFDQLAKQIGKKALGPCGPTVVHDEIAPDALHADLRHEPDPARAAERAPPGLLGRIAALRCLIEVFSHAPDAGEVRGCLIKHLAFWQKLSREARAKRTHAPAARSKKAKSKPPQAEASVEPFLWILATSCSATVLTGLGFVRSPDWPAGVYLGPGLLRIGILVASELPRERETLLVRLMTAGPLLPQAIRDLVALPANAHERVVAEPILLGLQHALVKKASRSPEEQEFIVTMHDTWEQAREEGRLAQARATVRRVLSRRGLVANRAEESRIDACPDIATLEQWLDQALAARSVAEALHGGAAASASTRRRRVARTA